LIRINDYRFGLEKAGSGLRGIPMPFDAMVMSALVLVIFFVLAGVIAWADYQTRPERLKKH
jgi:hypothetical protein